MRTIFACVVALSSLLLPSNAQWEAGYSSTPTYVQTFDSAPTASQLSDSQGRFQWVPQAQGRKGLAYLNRRSTNYIDVERMADIYGARMTGETGPEFSFECWLLASDWASWARIFDLSINTMLPNGTYTSNSQGNAITLQHAPSGNGQYGYQVTNGGLVMNAYGTGRLGEWAHIVVVSQIIDPNDLNAITAGRHSIYCNGVLLSTATGYLPRRLVRNLHWVGRSAAVLNGDNYLQGFLDSFAFYNTPLSQEAVIAHMQTSRPPRFELTFAKNPSTLGSTTIPAPTYGWVAADTAFTNGLLTLNGNGQYIDLTTSAGASSAGTTMPSSLNGASGGSPASPGWTYTAIVKFNAFNANAAIFDMSGGSNRMRLFTTAAGNVVFNLNSLTIQSSSVLSTGSWYHITAAVSSAGNATLYVNRDAVGSATGSALAQMTFSLAYLGRSTDATPVYLNAQIDACRWYDMVLSQAEIFGLHSTITAAPTGTMGPIRTAPAISTAPFMSYTFSKAMGEFGSAGLSNHTWALERNGRRGVASTNGRDHAIQLLDYPDDQNKLMANFFGGSMTFEATVQLLDLSNQAPIWSFAGPRSYADNNLHIINTYNFDAGNINSLRAEQYTGGSQTSIVICRACTNGSWIHLVWSISQLNDADNTTATSGLTTLYANGQFIGSYVANVPPIAHRPNLWLAKPAWFSDSFTSMNIDSFFWYSTALSAEAVVAHHVLPIPPLYELVFSTEPVPAGRAYGWIRNDTTGIHDGIVTLSGSQYVDMAATTGSNSIASTVRFPEYFGTDRTTVGVADNVRDGWSFDVSFLASSVAVGSTILEFSSTGGANALRLAFTPAGLVFTSGVNSIECGVIATNQWTHVAISIARDGSEYENQCWVDGERVSSTQTPTGIPYQSRTIAMLGKCATEANSFFQGQVDAVRIMQYSLVSEDIRQLYIAYSSERRVVDPPAFQSGPIVAYSFDKAPEVPSESDSAVTYNYYKWQLEPPAYARNDSHRGIAIFNDSVTSYTSRDYIDMNFDADSYGQTLPQTTGGSMSFEFWANIESLQSYQRIIDIGDDESAGIGNGDAAGHFNLIISAGSPGSTLHFENYYAQGVADRIALTNTWVPGQWIYVVGTIDATVSPAMMAVYINGQLRSQVPTTAPPVRTRRSAWIGKSNWDNLMLAGSIDALYIYNYALTPSAVSLRMRLPNPPQFEAAFEQNPSKNPAFATYGWQALNSESITHTGELTFNRSLSHWINLNSGSGNSSIGQNFPALNGKSIGIGQDGFTLEISCRWSDLTGRSKVIDLANGGGRRIGVDSFAVGNDGQVISLYVNNGQTDATSIVPLFNAVTNQYYHFMIVATAVFNRTDIVDYTLYHDGSRITTFIGQVAPVNMLRSRTYIGRSNTQGEGFFSGGIDLIRYYSYAVNQQTALFLARQSGTNGAYIVPSQPSSSSTGVSARSSSSSSAPAAVTSAAVATSTPTTPSTGGASTTGTSTAAPAVASSSSSSSLNGGAIAGIVIGSLVGVALICLALFCLCFGGRTGGKMQKLEEDRVEDSRTGEAAGETYAGEDEVELQNV